MHPDPRDSLNILSLLYRSCPGVLGLLGSSEGVFVRAALRGGMLLAGRARRGYTRACPRNLARAQGPHTTPRGMGQPPPPRPARPAPRRAHRASRAAARAPRMALTHASVGTRRCRLNALHLPLTGSSPGCRTGEASAGPAQWQCVSPVTAISSLRGCGSSRPPLITHSPPNTPFYYLINAHCQRARAECSCKP